MVNSKSKSGEAIGSIEETIAKTKKGQEEKPKPPETLSQEEQIPEGVGEEVGEGLYPEDQRQQSPLKLEQSRKLGHSL